MEKGELRKLFLSACNEIAKPLINDGWKPSQKGQCWKKKHANKDLTYKVEFQSSTKNDPSHITVIPHLAIYSIKAKAYDIEKTGNQYSGGCIWSTNLGYITPDKNWMNCNVAGANKDNNIRKITDAIVQYGLPIFSLFDNPTDAVSTLREKGTSFYEHIKGEKLLNLMPLTFMVLYGSKEAAEEFFNISIEPCKYKNRIHELYKSLEIAEKIDLNHSEFYQANHVKKAYVEGLSIWDKTLKSTPTHPETLIEE